MKGFCGVNRRINWLYFTAGQMRFQGQLEFLPAALISLLLLTIFAAPGSADLLSSASSAPVSLLHNGFSAADVSGGPISPQAIHSLAWVGSKANQSGRTYQPISKKKAIGASMLLPGLGQRMAGHDKRGNVFIATEIAILTALIANKVKGKVRKDRYINYAEQFGGIRNGSARSDGYFQKLGIYVSSDDYVTSLRTTARGLFGNDLEARNRYIEERRPSAEEAWQWPSNAYRREFREIRKTSRNAYRKANLMFGVSLINRILSAVDAARLVHKMNAKGTIYATFEDDIGYLGVYVSLD